MYAYMEVYDIGYFAHLFARIISNAIYYKAMEIEKFVDRSRKCF